MHWFRIGRLEVTTTVLVVLLGAIGTLVGALVPPVLNGAMLHVPELLSGEVWRLVTWPWVDRPILWTILTFFIFWYFGKYLESDLGRDRMMSFLFGLWLILTAAHTVAGLMLPGSTILIGLGMIQLLMILLFIMEQPKRPFFFGIPAWIIGAILIGLEVLNNVAMGNAGGLVALVLSLGGTLLWAQRFGLLTGLPRFAQPRPARPKVKAKAKPRRAPRTPERDLSDDERMDQLLDKINASGFDSLTEKERDEMLRITERRQRR